MSICFGEEDKRKRPALQAALLIACKSCVLL
jgi:hypothetical protein